MAVKKPIVNYSGQLKELQTGDTVEGASASAYALEALFDEYADATTTGTGGETLYTYTLPAATLAANGDSVNAVYMGTFAANANQKELNIDWFGVGLTGIATMQNGGAWRIEVDAVRVSASVVRVSVQTTHGTSTSTEYTEVTGLTLANAQALELSARTPTSAGDLTARAAKGVFIPAAPVTTPDYLLFLGDRIVFLGDPLAFNP